MLPESCENWFVFTAGVTVITVHPVAGLKEEIKVRHRLPNTEQFRFILTRNQSYINLEIGFSKTPFLREILALTIWIIFT